MTTGEHLLHVAEAGLALSDVGFDEDVLTHLTVLMAIEDALDQGRVSVALTGSGIEHTDEITAKLDELRYKIRSLIDRCDREEFSNFMESRGNRLKLQFTA